MRVPDGPGEAPAVLLGGCKILKIHCFFFILFSSFPCILRLGSCFWRLVEQISCQPVLFEVGLGAKRVPRWSRMALVRLQRGCLEGAN